MRLQLMPIVIQLLQPIRENKAFFYFKPPIQLRGIINT